MLLEGFGVRQRDILLVHALDRCVEVVEGTTDKRLASQQLWGLMVEQGRTWEDLGPDLTDGAPRPLPQMKVTPIY